MLRGTKKRAALWTRTLKRILFRLVHVAAEPPADEGGRGSAPCSYTSPAKMTPAMTSTTPRTCPTSNFFLSSVLENRSCQNRNDWLRIGSSTPARVGRDSQMQVPGHDSRSILLAWELGRPRKAQDEAQCVHQSHEDEIPLGVGDHGV